MIGRQGEKLLDSQQRTNSSSSKAMHREVIEANENFIADDGCAFFLLHFTLTLALFGSRGIISHIMRITFVRNGTHRRRQSKVLRRRMKACSLRSRDSRSVPET